MAAAPATESRPERLDPRALDRAWARLAAQPSPPWLHGEVARRLAERLSIVRQIPLHVFDWWSELGGGAASLAQAYPKATVTGVLRPASATPSAASAPAASPSPAAPAWRRWLGLGAAGPRAIAQSAVPAGQAQLVWSNMSLHWAPDAPTLMREWQRALVVDGFLMFTTLGPGTLQSLRELYRAYGWGTPHAPWTDMHDLGDMLVEAGFADPVMDQETLRLTWSSPQAALDELRTLGANDDAARFAGLRTPRWRERLLEALGARRDAQGRVVLEFEVVYGHAFKPVPRAKVAPQTQVGLDDMKAMLNRGRPSR
ncbi:MAG TPA: biotin synthase [Burkholderiaceae bacterium]|nr:biotin synthase [Burkholderiaceae bacterium]